MRGDGACLLTNPLPSAVDLSALSGLRDFLAMRLYRFFVQKDEVLSADSTIVGGDGNGGGRFRANRHGWGGSGGSGGGGGGGADVPSRGKGKQRARPRQGGRFQLVPLRLLGEHRPSSKGQSFRGVAGGGSGGGGGYGHGSGHRNARHARWRGVIPRDAIGPLLKCCWSLVPVLEGSTEASAGVGHGRVTAGPGKRAEAEAIARAVLGAGGARKGTRGGRGATAGGVEVCTREGEALVAVVEFLEGGGGMEVSHARAGGERGTGDET